LICPFKNEHIGQMQAIDGEEDHLFGAKNQKSEQNSQNG
jgi:hypothetical protein